MSLRQTHAAFRVVAGLVAAALCACSPSATAPSVAALAPESVTNWIRGAVVYERPDGIYKMVLGEKAPVRLARGGRYPRWSPDGEVIAFLRGKAVWLVRADGTGEERLAEADEPVAVAYHRGGKEVLFIDGKAVRAVDVATRRVRTLARGSSFRELDISPDGRQLVVTVHRLGYHMYAYDLATGRRWRLASGCSASFSPDGRLVTNNSGDHRKLYLRRWQDGRIVRVVDAPSGRQFDNQRWSNHPDWIVSKTEGEKAGDVFVHHIPRARCAQVTFSGDCDRPDLFVAEVVGEERSRVSRQPGGG